MVKSQSLGNSNVHLRRFRVFTFAFICVAVPILLTMAVLSALNIAVNIVETLWFSGIFLIIIVLVSTTSIPMGMTLKWAWSERPQSRTMKKVGRKTVLLAVVNLALVAFMISLLVYIFRSDSNIWGTYGTPSLSFLSPFLFSSTPSVFSRHRSSCIGMQLSGRRVLFDILAKLSLQIRFPPGLLARHERQYLYPIVLASEREARRASPISFREVPQLAFEFELESLDEHLHGEHVASRRAHLVNQFPLCRHC